MPDSKQLPQNRQETEVKKPWETPRLSMLDIKTTTLGGASNGLVEDGKTFPDS